MPDKRHVVDREVRAPVNRLYGQARDSYVRVDAIGLADPDALSDQYLQPGPFGELQYPAARPGPGRRWLRRGRTANERIAAETASACPAATPGVRALKQRPAAWTGD